MRELRTSRKWSLDRLASAAGISKPTLIDLEKARTTPSLETVVRVLRALEFESLEELALGLARWGGLGLFDH